MDKDAGFEHSGIQRKMTEWRKYVDIKHILRLLAIIIVVFFTGLLVEDFIEGLPAAAIPLTVPSEILYEILPILMSFSIFTMTWFAYSKNRDNQCLFMGMIFLVIGLIDLCHTLSYPYMPDFITPNSFQKSAVLHSEARLISAVLFVVAAYIKKDSLPELINRPVLFTFAIILFLISLVPALFYLDSLPLLYSNGGRSTALIIRQFITAVLLLYASYLFIRRYQETGERYFIPLVYGFIILIVSDLVYFNYGLPGHLLKLIAFFFLYLALYKSSVELPYEMLSAAEERLLHTAEERYRNLFDNANDAIITTDLDGRVTSWNKSAERIFGWSEQEAMGKDLFILVCPEKTAAANKEQTIRSTLAYTVVSGIEKACLRKDRTKICVSLTVSAILDINRNIIGMSAIIRDITERKLAEDALKESEERYRKLVEFSPYAIAIHSGGRIVFVNPAGAKLLGAENPERLIGKPIMDIVHPDYRDAVKEQIRLLEEKGINVSPVEEKFVRLDGSAIDVEVTAMPFTYRGKPGIQVMVRDITERKLGEERLRLFRSLINQSNDAIFVDDTETGRILDVNYKACSSLGYTREELLRMHAFDIETTLPGYFSWKEHVEDVKKKGYVVVEGIHRRKDGTTFPVEVNVTYTIIGKNSYMVAVARDITERKRAEEELRKSEERFRQISETAGEWIWEVDAGGLYTYSNPVIEKILGYKPQEIIGKKHFYDLFAPDVREELKNTAFETFARKESFRGFVNSNVHKNGNIVILETSGLPILDERGDLLGYRGTDTDITERRRAEEALRRAYDELELRVAERTAELERTNETLMAEITERKRTEQRLRLFSEAIEEAADGIQIIGLDGRIIFSNRAVETIYGFSPEELKGEHVDEMNADPTFASSVIIPSLKKTGRWVGELMVKHKSRRIFPILLTASVVKDNKGEPIAMVGIIHDITERKRMEEELRRSIRQLNAILTNIPDIAWLKDKESRFIAVNKPFADTAGVTPEYLAGKTDFDIWPKELAEGYRADDREVMATGRRKQVVEPLVDKEGKRTWVETIKTPIYDYKGEVIGTTGISRDVTERKRAEEELKKRTEELARSNADLEQFAYIASHDLREPLRMISGFAQLLERRYKGKLDKDADEFIDFIVDGATRMQRMIEDLLSYSRIGTRGKPFGQVDLETVLDQALTNLKVVIEENKAAVTHDPLPAVIADDSQMVQLFQNLVGNAIKFRKKEEPPRVHISAERKGNEWVFSVKDNGIGIAPEFFDHLFQLFQRAHAAGEYPGTGIGLAICKKIVERHSGRIWAESVQGKGSTFYFTMPAIRGWQK